MTDLAYAKAKLSEGDYTIALCRGAQSFTDTRRGIAPMLGFLEQGIDLTGFSVADRVVGKAAALLFVRAGISAVYAAVISEPAIAVLAANAIPCEWDRRVEYIINRAGNGPCPMEHAVRNIDDPKTAEAVLREALRALQSCSGM